MQNHIHLTRVVCQEHDELGGMTNLGNRRGDLSDLQGTPVCNKLKNPNMTWLCCLWSVFKVASQLCDA